jgi:pyruvate dehydrogenase (quinone)
MACAHARFTGEVGVCLATSGPVAIHFLNGLYDAKSDRQPVVAVVGQHARTALGGDYQQEVDLVSLFKDVAHEFVHMVTTPVQVRHLVDRAVRIARDQRTVTCVIVPNDLQTEDAVEGPPHTHGSIHSGVGYTPPRVLPRDEDLRRAADVLNAGHKVAVLVGQGALGATDEVIEVADVLGAASPRRCSARLCFRTTCRSGQAASACSDASELGADDGLRHAADGRLELPVAEFLPKRDQARGVQIDIDGRMLGIRYPMEVPPVGDSAETLRASCHC